MYRVAYDTELMATGKLDKLNHFGLPGSGDMYEHIVTCDESAYKEDPEVVAKVVAIRGLM